MADFKDNLPLTCDELTFQCIALTKAAIFAYEEAPIREALLFVLLEKTSALYDMLGE